MGWKSADKHNHRYMSTVIRVKYLFDSVDDKGLWKLKLDPDQGELFGKDIFYDEENIESSSVRFESDYVAYKPHADLIVNAYGHATVPLKEWRCGVKVLRPTEDEENPYLTLLEKWIRVRGERYIQDDIIGASFTTSIKATKIPIRYELANGGMVKNPNYTPEEPDKTKQYLRYATYNPVGVGIFHKSMFDENIALRAPQIEAMNEVLDKPNLQNPPQGFGFIGRSWQPRIKKAGTFNEKWVKEKHPVMPDDYQETYNNAAHPDLQLEGYFEPFDKIILHNLVKDRYEQSFKIPNFYFKAQIEEAFPSEPYFLDIDTVIVDLMEDDMTKNTVFISYRKRIPTGENIQQANLNMYVPKDFIGESHG